MKVKSWIVSSACLLLLFACEQPNSTQLDGAIGDDDAAHHDSGSSSDVNIETRQDAGDAGSATDAGDVGSTTDAVVEVDQGEPELDATLRDRGIEIEASVSLGHVDVAISGACVVLTVSVDGAEGNRLEGLLSIEVQLDGATLHSDERCDQLAQSNQEVAIGDERSWYLLVASQTESVSVNVVSAGALLASSSVIVAERSYNTDERVDATLVVYNRNAPDALQIAEGYQQARGLPLGRLCGVSLPRGHFATPAEMNSARDTIAADCVCPLVEEPQDPCTAASVHDHIAAQPITHLVMIRGLPGRLTQTPWPSRGEEPALDYYLSYSLATGEQLFEEGSNGGARVLRDPFRFRDKIGPALNPASDRYFAIARVEAITMERTAALIERTLLAEQEGFTGNVVSEARQDSLPRENPGRFLTGTFSEECLSYLSHEPFVFESDDSSWPFERCRWGTSGTALGEAIDGMMPGYPDTTTPYPTNVSWFVGSNARPDEPINNFHAFHDYNTMLRWRHRVGECVTECSSFEDVDERERCAAESNDYFAAINSECVGVHRYFVGQQHRSWPVQYYGFFPQGWSPYYGGDSERTAPRVLEDGGYVGDEGDVDGRYDDSNFLRFGSGSPQALNEDLCEDSAGEPVGCPERVAVNIARQQRNTPPYDLNEGSRLRLRFRYRNQGAPMATMQLRARLGGGDDYYQTEGGELPTLDLAESHLEWTEASFDLVIPPEVNPDATFALLQFDGRLHRKLRGFFDLDAVSLSVIDSTMTAEERSQAPNLIGDAICSFADYVPRKTVHGGSAADVIDRMGGIGYWGSSSHHLTGGAAYNPRITFMRVSTGDTFGEALSQSGAKSGLAYVDPLLRPYAARIYNDTHHDLYGNRAHRLPDAEAEEAHQLRLNALNGTNAIHQVQWSLDHCPATEPRSCEEWTELLTGQGAARGFMIDPALYSGLPEGEGLLRLKVWRPDREDEPIYSFAFVVR
jgi:hypothetical protein